MPTAGHGLVGWETKAREHLGNKENRMRPTYRTNRDRQLTHGSLHAGTWSKAHFRCRSPSLVVRLLRSLGLPLNLRPWWTRLESQEGRLLDLGSLRSNSLPRAPAGAVAEQAYHARCLIVRVDVRLSTGLQGNWLPSRPVYSAARLVVMAHIARLEASCISHLSTQAYRGQPQFGDAEWGRGPEQHSSCVIDLDHSAIGQESQAWSSW
ncbi:hypothetical protein IAQ61_009774, partial [Plenodomus lingam]|uniref:Predicted protein n=1 Tax=Leptosphaeria maculans (strain JN3 / isolate v23.1.3 / race Av1-4-5-6-7-8) TaxID=985895 RepID=E4ZUN7_LEPMJ